ncbi:MAG: hypothetical protein IJQ62_07765 [Clostridia bacterium]|nr:hypothetical protein [Clostridia bacterium]
MKKWILVLLLNAFILTLCTAVLADTAYDPWAAQKEALKAAGRETEVVLAGWDCWKGNTPWASVMLVQAGDTAQLTVLEMGEDGKWTIVACSDTIPSDFITDAAIEGSWDTAWPDTEGTGYFSLTMEQLIPAKAYGEKTVYQAYRTLSFTRTEQGKWILCGACDIPFEDARGGYCPYHLLWLTKDGWLYMFYEEIMDENGWPIDRSEEIQRKTVSMEEMTPYTELSAFDYPAFLSVLHAQAPTEYEHAPVATMPPRPTVTPANPPAGDAHEFVYYNTNGGKYYHADACRPRVDPTYWPLTPVSFEKINNDKGYSRLLPCSVCGAPERPNTDAGKRK